MKRLTAVLALVTVIGLMAATSAPASAAPSITTAPRTASVVSLLDRVLAILGLGAPATPTMGVAPKTGTAPVTPSPNSAIWGGQGCRLLGTC
jgi:hypothetical protein